MAKCIMPKSEKTDNVETFIIEALFALMREKDFKKITIGEIARKAGVARVTYYRRFKSKEDIVKKFFEKKAESFSKMTASRRRAASDFYEACFVAFSNLKASKREMLCLVKSRLEYVYLDCLNEMMAANFQRNKYSNMKYSPYFFSGSIFNISIEWIKRGCKEPVKQLADEYFRTILPLIKARPAR